MADEQQATPNKYYAVILTAEGDTRVEEFASAAAMAIRLRELVDRDVSVFPFFGQRCHISKPPFRYLMTPTDNIALFDAPTDKLEPDDTGYLGVDPVYFEGPPQIKVPATHNPDAQADEFFEDSSEDVAGIFDNILPDPEA